MPIIYHIYRHVFFFLLVSLSGISAQAQEYESPRVLALAGSGHAAPWLNDAIFMNPSYASYTPVYVLSSSYLMMPNGRNYSVSIQDSRTEMFQAGAAFSRREGLGVINVGASKVALANWGIGLGFKYLIPDEGKLNQDISASSTYLFTKTFNIAFVADNLLENKTGQLFGAYRTFILGVRYLALDTVSMYIDPFWSPSYELGPKFGFAAGLEFSLMADFFFRIGRGVNTPITYMNDRGDGFGFGLGWVAPRLSLDYGMHRTTISDRGSNVTTAHTASCSVFF